MINKWLRRFGVEIMPVSASAKMWREQANVIESSGYPSRTAVAEYYRRCARWAGR